MLLSTYPFTSEYINDLANFRDQALVNSYESGRRRALGSISCGIVKAEWTTKAENRAKLAESGLKLRNFGPFHAFPTSLFVRRDLGSLGIEQIAFNMDLDNKGIIEYHWDLLNSTDFSDVEDAAYSSRYYREQVDPTINNTFKELLISEMERGASGDFRINHNSSNLSA